MRTLPFATTATLCLVFGCTESTEPEDSANGSSSPATWSAVTIDFDELNDGDVVANQFADHVRFSVPAGQELQVATRGNFGNSLPNYVCTADQSSSINCEEDITIDFERPARDIQLSGIGVERNGIYASARVFAQDELLGVEDALGDGNSTTPEVLNLSGYTGVTRIELVQIDDIGGVAWDDLIFELRD